MHSRRKLLKYAAAPALLSAFSAMDGLVTPTRAQNNLTTVRFGDQTGSEVDYAAVWVADMNGYYKDEGIQLDRKTYGNGPAALLDLNNLDAVTAAIVPYMLYAARGGEVTMVMSTTKGNAPIVGKQQYTAVKQLAGKNVGTPGIGTIHDAVLGYIEESQGFKVNHVPAKISDVAVMIEKGEVEAFIGWEPASAAAVAQAPQLLHYIERLPPIPNAESLELAFRPGYIKDHPDLVVKFIRATLKGISWMKSNGADKTAQLLAKKMNDPNIYKVNLDALQSVDLTQPRIDMPSTRIWLAAIAKQGKIPEDLVKNIDGWVMKYVDYSYLEKAQASL
jgi:ABC-type nitrate/sulfonate/bicarbonate transport system substrate-binding protein